MPSFMPSSRPTVHAIGSLVAGHIFDAFHGQAFDATEYERKLAELNPATWRSQGGEP